jgi:hypothetical protein
MPPVVAVVESLGRRLRLALGAFLPLVLAAPLAAQAAPARVALVLDQDSPRFQPLVEQFQNEVRSFFRPGEITLLPPVAGDGTAAGVQRVLQRALTDSSVAVVVSLGSIGSHLLARAGSPPKPAIAAAVIDVTWQGIPLREGSSGVPRLAYVEQQSYSVASTVADFHRLVPFRKIAVLLDRNVLAAIPGLQAGAVELVRGVGAEVAVVPVGGSASEALPAIPADADAAAVEPTAEATPDAPTDEG